VRRAAAALLALVAVGHAADARAVGAPTRAAAWTARVVVATEARSRPDGGRVLERVPVTTSWGGAPVTLLVHGVARDAAGRRWLRVGLLHRARRRTGWIRADVAVLARTAWRVEVSLHRRRVVVRHAGRVRWRLRAVVGAPNTPTPTGTFSVLERVRQTDPNTFPGAYVLFLTAYSPVVRWFDGNDGQVGLHGRGGASLRDPLGTARSHGCIRLTNRAIARIARHVPDGSPVVIHP
jgi:lipoprotein-anchoring transpeptidase ErfK/SrfK